MNRESSVRGEPASGPRVGRAAPGAHAETGRRAPGGRPTAGGPAAGNSRSRMRPPAVANDRDRPAARQVPGPRPASSRELRASQAIVETLFGPAPSRRFAVRYWDALEEPGAEEDPPFTLVLEWPGALRRLLVPPTERNVAEAYVFGDVDVIGDMEAATRELAPAFVDGMSLRRVAGLIRDLRALPAARRVDAAGTTGRRPFRGRWRPAHTRGRDRQAVRYHYDVGNDFFALWLDRRMVYSCAYFPRPDADLDTAQEAKLDLICRKLQLQRGERLLDVGCGWGGLILHAAARYGVDATGITLSERQAELARARIAEAGLGDRCRVEVRDYRDMPANARFDKVASIGMVEHVGEARLPEYYATVYRLLEPGGLFLNQGIVTLRPAHTPVQRWKARMRRRWTSFIEHYVFPDARLLGPVTVLSPAERAGFELRDVDNLREHYAQTLRWWVRRLESRREEAIRLTNEQTYRVWRLYMAGCAHQFASGRVGLLQTLLARPDTEGRTAAPWTRAEIYAAMP